VVVDNFTNSNKTNNYLSPQLSVLPLFINTNHMLTINNGMSLVFILVFTIIIPWCRLFLSFQNICLCILRLIDLYSVFVLRLKLNHVFIIVLLFFHKFISWMEFHAIISIISVSGRETPCFSFWDYSDFRLE
jgi:hypothetical protein